MPVVLAHQGGWDEMLLVLGPIAIIVSLVGVANRRANKGGTHPQGASRVGTDQRGESGPPPHEPGA